MLAGEQPPVAVGQPLFVHRRGVELAAGELVGGMVGVEQVPGGSQADGRAGLADPEGEPLVDLLVDAQRGDRR